MATGLLNDLLLFEALKAATPDLQRKKTKVTDPEVRRRILAEPEWTMRAAGLEPDAWQVEALRSTQSILLNVHRQGGKTECAAGVALATAIPQRALVLLISPSLRQSQELFRDVMDLWAAMGRPCDAKKESALRLELRNGSRILSLPGAERTIRGYSGVSLLILDEAARIPDELFHAVTPMLAVSGGRTMALSTPFGKRGWFWKEWTEGQGWLKINRTADQCPRITPDFLAMERVKKGERWFRQEYYGSFEEVEDAVFAADDIMASLVDDLDAPVEAEDVVLWP